MKSICLTVSGLLAIAGICGAQAAPISPFADATQYLQARGATAPATQRLIYEVTTTRGDGAPEVTQTSIEVAPDWSLVTVGDRKTLWDFKLGRRFDMRPDGFTSVNASAGLMARVLERQNRRVVDQIVGASAGKDCDADAELAVVVSPPATPISLAERGRTGALMCEGRTISAFTRGDGQTAPAALWPTLNAIAPIHPALFRQMRSSGAAPARIENTPGGAAGLRARANWRLVRVEPTSLSYALSAGLPNTTAAMIDAKVGAGLGALAVDAVSGRALGGAPTPDSWAAHLRTVAQKEGPAAAGMLLLPTANIFPKSFEACQAGARSPFCEAAAMAQATLERELAPQAVIAIALSDEAGNPNSTTAGATDAVIGAMRSARATPQRDHPALGAAYALVAEKFDRATAEKARAAGLPTDFPGLHRAAVRALPYNPAYWLDLGDSFTGAYDLSTAMTLYETGMALPIAELDANPAVGAKQRFFKQIRDGFPDAVLPVAP